MRKGFFPKLALSGIRKNRKIYYPYILTAVLTTAMMYIMGSLHQSAFSYSDTLVFSLQLGIIVTSLFSVIFLFYTNSFLMKRRKKEFGLYNILGMEKKHLARLILWETVFMLLLSLLLGLGVGVLLDKLMHLLLGRMVGQYASMTFAISYSSMNYTAMLIGITFGLILLNSIRQVYMARPVELLRSGEVGEREPKTKWVLTLIGLLTLGAGYWLSVTVQDPAAMLVLFFFAVILVIVGTYLLFTSGSITLIKLLRKNKRYYYKPDHFISVSGMIYRMKQNAVGLANVCILSTMVLVMVFSTVALWTGMQDMLKNRVRADVELETRETDVDALYATVDEALKEAELTRQNDTVYRYFSLTALRDGNTIVTDVSSRDVNALTDVTVLLYLLPAEDFARVTGQPCTLAPGEVLLQDASGMTAGDTLELMGEAFRVKGRMSTGITNSMTISSLYENYFVVMDSLDTVEHIVRLMQQRDPNTSGAIRTSLSFDLSGTDAQKGDFAFALESRLRKTHDVRYFNDRVNLDKGLKSLYGGLLFVGLFLGALFLMALILIIYYKQISEGYDDRERYRIMRKVGLSKREIKHSISSQILIVFFLPLVASGLHVAFALPGISTMFKGLSMTNETLILLSALGTFVVFGLLYGAVYLLTAKVYYRIVSE